MDKTVNSFSRIIAGLLILTVSFMTFSCPVNPPPEETSPQGPSPLTPGVGDPRYFYLDSDGNNIETEVNSTGRTGLIVENNKFAEGVLVYSDDTGTEDRVAFVYENSIVSMFFKKSSNFPHRMAISDDSDNYYAYVSPYDEVNHTYNVTFTHDFTYEIMDHVVLNENIFSLYEANDDLSDSQNRRMANMTIAMGVWGSLYATFDQQMNLPSVVINRSVWGVISGGCRKVAAVFTTIAVAAVVVATVVAPIVSFVSPIAGLAISSVAWWIAGESLLIAATAIRLAFLFEYLDSEDTLPSAIIPTMIVTLLSENNRNINYNSDGNHEEFHIPPGSELAVKFYSHGADFSGLTQEALNGFMFIDEPSVSTGSFPANLGHFTNPPATIEKTSSNEEFIIKFKRSLMTGCNGDDGKVNFGFVFDLKDKDGNKLDLTVNDYTGGFYFRLPQDNFERKLYKNMVVIYFSVKEN